MRDIILILSILLLPSIANAGQFEDIARTLAAEAGGEGVGGMRLVAETIRNRMKTTKKTAWQVISQKGQYYGYTAKNGTRLYKAVKSQADQVTRELLAGMLGNKTLGALYFRRPDEPMFKWTKKENFTYRYKNHMFYK